MGSHGPNKHVICVPARGSTGMENKQREGEQASFGPACSASNHWTPHHTVSVFPTNSNEASAGQTAALNESLYLENVAQRISCNPVFTLKILVGICGS